MKKDSTIEDSLLIKRAQDGNELSGRGQNVGKRGKRHDV